LISVPSFYAAAQQLDRSRLVELPDRRNPTDPVNDAILSAPNFQLPDRTAGGSRANLIFELVVPISQGRSNGSSAAYSCYAAR
jgi:hypothetical protein